MRRALVLMLFMSVLTGCGTVASLGSDDANKVYGGVRFDGAMIGLTSNEDAAELEGMWIIGLLDFPFSLVADTVVLPFTLLKMGASSEAADKPAK